MEKIVSEVFLDDVTFIAEADNEIVEAVMAVDLHDMPQDWTTADLNHWFRTDVSFLAQPGAHTSR